MARWSGIGTHAESAQDVRGVSRDRRVAGVARGGRMSSERAAMKQQAGPPPSIFGRGPMGGFGMPVQKAKDFKGTLRRLTGYLQPHQTGADDRDRRRRDRDALQRRRPEAARQGDDESVRGLPRARARDVGRRHRLRLRRQHPDVAGGAVRGQRVVPLPAAVPDVGHRAEHGLCAAPRRRGEVQPAAAEVLRFADARRDPQPRRQRSRQHQQHAAAEPDAAD